MAEIYSFDLDKGTDWFIELHYKDSAGVPINLTGATFEGKIRATNNLGTVKTTFDITAIDLTIGHIKIGLTNTKTSLLADGINVYDVEMTLSSIKTRLLEGEINARSEVTYT